MSTNRHTEFNDSSIVSRSDFTLRLYPKSISPWVGAFVWLDDHRNDEWTGNQKLMHEGNMISKQNKSMNPYTSFAFLFIINFFCIVERLSQLNSLVITHRIVFMKPPWYYYNLFELCIVFNDLDFSYLSPCYWRCVVSAQVRTY